MLNALIPHRFNALLFAYDFVQQEIHLHKNSKFMQHADKQAKASEIIRNHIGFSLGAALVPFPAADLVAVSAVQLNMLRQLAKLYGIGFMDTLGNNVISAVVGAGVARLGASLIKAIPGVGTVIGELTMPVMSGASTYALGHVVANHFHKGGTLENLDLRNARKDYENEMEKGHEVAREIKQQAPPNAADQTMDKLKKAADLHQAGILTDEEFRSLKEKLLKEL